MTKKTIQVTPFDGSSLRVLLSALIVLAVTVLLVTACGGNDQEHSDESAAAEVDEAEHMHESGDEHHSEEEHMAGDHDIPEEADSTVNPVAATEESVAAGAALFTIHCAVCHGDTGAGDGPSAAGLDPKPANLSEEHVQGLSDGALFYIISHGRSETAMPAWEDTLSEEERWHTVNFIRTFKE